MTHAIPSRRTSFRDHSSILLALALLLVPAGSLLAGDQSPASSQDSQPASSKTQAAIAESIQPESSQLSVTQHSLTVNGREIQYTATTGCLPILDESGTSQAEMFFVAYTLRDADPAERPIAFAFNGGPGAASVFLQVGGIGPKRCPLACHGTALPEKYTLVDNESTWLMFTDLVFIDPIGTGFSHVVKGHDAKDFYSVQSDIRAAAKFIQLYTTRNQRWLSPKYLIGESYGTTRAAGLADFLQKDVGMNLDGLVLISAALNFRTFGFQEGNDLPYVLSLPTYTATAWYHQRLADQASRPRQATLDSVERWAMSDYLVALAAGSRLPSATRQEIVDQLAAKTGLTPHFVEQSGLRISNRQFASQLLRDKHVQLGILDSRVQAATGVGPEAVTGFDPAMYVVVGPWVAVLNNYLRQTLKYDTDRPYVFLSREANREWKWDADGSDVDLSPELAEAMTLNPHLRVFGAAGCFDLTTPYASQRYTYDHLPVADSLRKNIVFSVYQSGHQIYVSDKPLRKLTADVKDFFDPPAPG